jgi:hypothetical protein
MNEHEWLTCTAPQTMLEFLRGKVSDRKLRLFAVAAFKCRGFENQDGSTEDDVVEEARQAVVIAERYADGHISGQEIEEARTRLFFQGLLRPQAWQAAKQSCMSTINLSCRKGPHAVATMSDRLSSLIREIVGNPFRPVGLDPAWKKSDPSVSWPRRSTTSGLSSACRFWPKPLKKPGATTPTSSTTTASRDRMSEAAGSWTSC